MCSDGTIEMQFLTGVQEFARCVSIVVIVGVHKQQYAHSGKYRRLLKPGCSSGTSIKLSSWVYIVINMVSPI